MNWYGLHKKAAAWYQFGDTVTLYHGTNERNLREILATGLIVPPNPEQVAKDVLARYGFTEADVPRYVWEEDVKYRRSTPYVYCTTYKDQAKMYAAGAAHGGEIENSITKNIARWLESEKKGVPKMPTYRPVLITLELPWGKAKFNRTTDEMKEIIVRMNDWVNRHDGKIPFAPEGATLYDELNEINLEAVLTEPTPASYITAWEMLV